MHRIVSAHRRRRCQTRQRQDVVVDDGGCGWERDDVACRITLFAHNPLKSGIDIDYGTIVYSCPLVRVNWTIFHGTKKAILIKSNRILWRLMVVLINGQRTVNMEI